MHQNELKGNVETEIASDKLTAALDTTVEAAVALGISEGELIERINKSFMQNAGQNKIVPVMVRPVRKMYDSSAGP